MRLATARVPGAGTVALELESDVAYVLDAADVGEVLARPEWRAALRRTGEVLPADPASFAPVVPRPSKFLCLGHNFRSHVAEMGRPLPEHPTLFAKVAATLIGPRDPVRLPEVSDRVDWEAELAVVIGTRVRRADARQGAEAIAGYTLVNDVSVRDWQNRTPQWFQGKNFEGTTPVGPWLVTPDEIADPADLAGDHDDGEVVQKATSADFIFTPAEVVAYISTFTTLEPGDVVSLGTPGGVGAARDPQVFLRPGQVVRVAASGIGELVNECRRDGE